MKNKKIILKGIIIFFVLALIALIFLIYKSNNEVNQQENTDQLSEKKENEKDKEKKEDYSNRAEMDKDLLKIGDLVYYKPDEVEPYTLDSNVKGISLGSNNSMKQEQLEWNVLRKYEDGSIDLIGSPTCKEVSLNGALGYNNGVFYLNDICKHLYSNKSQNIEARSVCLEDLEYWLTNQGKNEIESSENQSTIFYDENSYYPELYAYENGEQDNIGKSQITSDDFKTPTKSEMASSKNNELTVKETFYVIDISEDNFGEGYKGLFPKSRYNGVEDFHGTKLYSSYSNSYWIASRYATCARDFAMFGLFSTRGDSIENAHLVYSNNSDISSNNHIRPVVHIEKDVPIYEALDTDFDIEDENEDEEEKAEENIIEDDGIAFIDNQIIVFFDKDIESSECEKIINKFNGKILGGSDTINYYLVQTEKHFTSYSEMEMYCEKLKYQYKQIDNCFINTVSEYTYN